MALNWKKEEADKVCRSVEFCTIACRLKDVGLLMAELVFDKCTHVIVSIRCVVVTSPLAE